jgi:hypothetical protein
MRELGVSVPEVVKRIRGSRRPAMSIAVRRGERIAMEKGPNLMVK